MLKWTFFVAFACQVSVCFADQPLVDLKSATFSGAETTPAGLQVRLNLPAKRSNWTSHDWKVSTLPAPLKLEGDGVRLTVKTDKPTATVGVYIAVRATTGGWYCHPWAANLTQPVNTGVARWRDFSPCEWTSPETGKFLGTDNRLTADQIDAVAIGSVNGLGIGPVEFTVTELAVVKTGPKPTVDPVQIDVTGRWLDVNGTRFVPAGVFGSFNLKEIEVDGRKVRRAEHYRLASDRAVHGSLITTPTTHMGIQVVGGDRGVPSPRLTNPNWQADAATEGTRYGQRAQTTGRPVYVEYYNEPYLNWANKNRRGFNPKFFDSSKATEGGPVTIAHDGTVAPFLRWTQNFDAPPWQWTTRKDWRRGKDASGRIYSDYAEPPPWARKQSSWAPETHPPETVKDGETYTVKTGKKEQQQDVTLTAFTPWHIYDETQFTYWSARGLGLFYNEPMLAFGKAFKAAGGSNAVYIAGWGFRPSEDHWAAFDLAFKPTIDAGISVIDGFCDHDYGGDPTKAVSTYEVVCAYSMTAHQKWLYGFNTECSGNYDPEAYANAGANGSPELSGARWITAKILHALDYVPDKARNFAHFGGGSFFHDDGEGLALQALINLRGQLLHVKQTDPDVYVAAAVDGTDPLNPRPAHLGDRQELVVAAFNSAIESRELKLNVTAPVGAPSVRVLKAVAGKPVLVESKEIPARLGSRELVVVTYPLTGKLAQDKPVKREQFFTNVVLQEVTPAQPVKTTVRAGPGQRAWLQYVVERLAEGEAAITLNGTTLPLPAAVTPENAPWLRRLPVDPKLLKSENELTVTVIDKAQAGFRLGSLSLVVEQE